MTATRTGIGVGEDIVLGPQSYHAPQLGDDQLQMFDLVVAAEQLPSNAPNSLCCATTRPATHLIQCV
jgi:hypothetical protein